MDMTLEHNKFEPTHSESAREQRLKIREAWVRPDDVVRVEIDREAAEGHRADSRLQAKSPR